jgi:Transglutaminase-like superfamily
VKRLIAESYRLLLWTGLILSWQRFQGLRMRIERTPLGDSDRSHIFQTVEICRAMDVACVLYFKKVQCLQRSAATTLLLRRYGHKAELVVGARMFPFQSHAWVEIDQAVVNDKPYMPDLYQVLDRC